LPRIRTIKQSIKSIKEQDPESCISEWWLRQLIKSDKIKCHRAGNRYLLDLDYLENYLKNPPITEEDKTPYGVIRKIVT